MLPSSHGEVVDGAYLEHDLNTAKDLVILRRGLGMVIDSSQLPAEEIQRAEIGLATSEQALARLGLQRVNAELDNKKNPGNLLVPLTLVGIAIRAIDSRNATDRPVDMGGKVNTYYAKVFRPQALEWLSQSGQVIDSNDDSAAGHPVAVV